MAAPLVGVIMGSRSDWETMRHACETLDELEVPYEQRVVSAHRTPDLLFEYAETAEERGLQVLIAGAGGSAMCADLGSRTIREEIDAMEVLGVNPVQRLVVPRVLAMVVVAVLLNGLVSVVGVAGGYFFNVVLQGGTPGAYLASFTALAQLPDLYVSQIKALIFGVMAALVASYKALNAKGGPKGVGDAVNQSVVITFMLLFMTNFIITAIYFQVVPQKGG